MAELPFILMTQLEDDDDINEHYVRGPELGEGLYGRTVQVTDVKDRTKRYAMKIQQKVHEYGQQPGGAEKELGRLFKELLILNRILPRHPHIIEIHDILVGPEQVFIVQELCEGGNMDQFFSVADNVSGRRAFCQLVDAVHTLHVHGVIHGDINGENILFKDPDFKQLKFIDFGCSAYRPDLASQVNDKFDHAKWFNTEDIEEEKARPDSTLVDTVALGKVLLGILSGNPMDLITSDEIFVIQTEFRPRTELFDEAAVDLLLRIGPPPFGPENPEEIFSMHQIRKHPWLTGAPFQPQDKPDRWLFRRLGTDLTALQRILKDWMVLRLTVLRNDRHLARFYRITGRILRGTEETGVLNVVDTLRGTNRMAMKVIYSNSRGNDQRQFAPGGFETRSPLLLYLELLITLRILPRHKHIVTIKNVYLSREYVAIVRELMDGHSLEDLLPLPICIPQSRMIFKQLADTIRFLHLHGVVHMDLHPHHIIFKNETPKSSWKIVHFSKARFVPEMAQRRHERFRPGRYLPDEIEGHLGSASDVQVDITALGRILHAMMAGGWEPDPTRCVNLLPRSEIFGDAATDLLSKIGPEPFGPAPGKRTSTMDEICVHPWLQQVPQVQQVQLG